MAGGLGAVTLSEAADYSVSDEDLRSFGLDEESRITLKRYIQMTGKKRCLPFISAMKMRMGTGML